MELLNTHPIKKSDLGFHGNLFGGKILAWVDSAASGLSMQLCDSSKAIVTNLGESQSCIDSPDAAESTQASILPPNKFP